MRKCAIAKDVAISKISLNERDFLDAQDSVVILIKGSA